ncbi:hypothetical protein DUNSADRAFT_8170, partial [Dunaliella salina]
MGHFMGLCKGGPGESAEHGAPRHATSKRVCLIWKQDYEIAPCAAPVCQALENLRNTEPLDTLPQNEFVWALPFSTALQHSADSANCVAERMLHMATTAGHSLHTLEQH